MHRYPREIFSKSAKFLLFTFLVKPFSPFSVKAEITEDTGQLNVSWKNPELPKNDLQFQVRYVASGEDINWKVCSDLMQTNALLRILLLVLLVSGSSWEEKEQF